MTEKYKENERETTSTVLMLLHFMWNIILFDGRLKYVEEPLYKK